jgi:hypothetical protein
MLRAVQASRPCDRGKARPAQSYGLRTFWNGTDRTLARLPSPPRSKAAQNVASSIVLIEAIVGKGEAMFREACRMGLQGIVSKRLGSAYVSTRTRNWLKIKNPDFERR